MSDQSSRQINQTGLQLIVTSEGFEPVPKPCPAGKPTVGHGHVVLPGERFDHPLSQAEGLALLRQDLDEVQEMVERLVRVPLNDDQFAGLVSFVFNVGSTAFAGSTLLKKLNQGDYQGAAAEFPRWDKITVTDKATGETHKKALPGLTTRRKAEQAMFLGGGGNLA